MELQYLVGLCCLRRNPEDVDIIIGDRVLDEAAEKRRDVDVTVKVVAEDGSVTAFQGLEVKKESKPLSVDTVEQLALKLKDMPEVTHHFIVSSSGFSDGAQKKAARHGVELYEFVEWRGAIQETLPHWKNSLPPQAAFHYQQWLLYWKATQFDLVVPGGPSRFSWAAQTELLASGGVPHSQFARVSDLTDALMLRSTQVLWRVHPATAFLRTPPAEIDPQHQVCRTTSWPQVHTMDVGADRVFLILEGQLCQIEQVTISGWMYWQSSYQVPEYKILRRVSDGEVFSSAMVASGRAVGEIVCFVFDPTSPVSGVHFVHLTDNQQKILHKLNLREHQEKS